MDVYELFKGSPLEVSSELEHIPDSYRQLTFKNLEEFEEISKKIPRLFPNNMSILSDCESIEDKEDFSREHQQYPEVLDLQTLRKKQKIDDISIANLYEGINERSVDEKSFDGNCLRTEIQIFPKAEHANHSNLAEFINFFELREIEKEGN